MSGKDGLVKIRRLSLGLTSAPGLIRALVRLWPRGVTLRREFVLS